MTLLHCINQFLALIILIFKHCFRIAYRNNLHPHAYRVTDRIDQPSVQYLIQANQHRNRKKPDWVIKQVIQIKAFHSQAGCRAIANMFNSRFENHKTTPETISKSFVANTIKNHLYDIQIIRRNIKSKPAHAIPFNKVWGIDLTFINEKPILGVIEHNSRKCLSLVTLKDKTSITTLR